MEQSSSSDYFLNTMQALKTIIEEEMAKEAY
jgi:hypothetical protein